jgi:transmembrane sensor
MIPEIKKEIIFDYFSGTTTAFQKRQIEEWAAIPENKELFFLWLWEWERNNTQYQADLTAGLNRHLQRMKDGTIQKTVEYSRPEKPFYTHGWKKLMTAACLALMIGSLGWIFRDNILYQSYSTGNGEVRSLLLPDSSRVALNANSTLKLPRFGFGKEARVVHLVGEAGFEVTSRPDKKRFIVKTDRKLEVVVLGTIFNVYARPGSTKVVLDEGKVKLHYQLGDRQKQLTLHPGDLASLDEKGDVKVQKTAHPSNYSAWKFHRFVFENTSLQEIGERIKESFGVTLVIGKPELATLTISGAFVALNAVELVELLCDASGDLAYSKSGKDKITLTTR